MAMRALLRVEYMFQRRTLSINHFFDERCSVNKESGVVDLDSTINSTAYMKILL
jgi:hypothetical protein